MFKRDLKMAHLRPRLLQFRGTTAAGTNASTVGNQDLSANASGGDGISDLTFIEKMGRLPLVIASPGANIADGGYANVETVATAAGVSIETANDSGVGDDGEVHSLLLGFDSAFEGNVINHIVKATYFSPRLHGLLVDGTGTAEIELGGSQFTLTDNGTGDYTLTPKVPFRRAPVVVGCCVGATQQALGVATATNLAINIKTFNAAASAADAKFCLFIMGSDHVEAEIGRKRRPVKVPQISPRLVAFRITDTGTPAIAVGSEDASITDNGTGDYTITLSKPFRRAGVAVATGEGARAQLQTDPTTSAIRVVRFNAAGTAADGALNVIALGFDHPVAH